MFFFLGDNHHAQAQVEDVLEEHAQLSNTYL